eukprot:FR743145.1.p2 GENE.FR743145.1~~FR743145.1.p2  ORF type:complete len:148 (-),score=19.96 FR743145.1:307-750(-)
MPMITPSAQLTLTKGNKSWSSTAVAAALELVDPLGSGPWLSTHCGRFFFFFFFFFFATILDYYSYYHLAKYLHLINILINYRRSPLSGVNWLDCSWAPWLLSWGPSRRRCLFFADLATWNLQSAICTRAAWPKRSVQYSAIPSPASF